MKRITYILVNNEGEIFGETYLENQIFSSEKKAQKQISYWNKHKVSNEQNGEEDWTIKRIVLNNYSHMQQHRSFWMYGGADTSSIKMIVLIGLVAVCFGVYGYVTLEPLLGMKAAPQIQDALIFNTALASVTIALILVSLIRLFKRFVFFALDINSWIKYKKENTEDLETFQMLPYLLLTKIDERERVLINYKTNKQLKKDNENESNKKII